MIGARLCDRRTELGLKSRDLAAMARMSSQHVRDIEAGRRQPGFRTLLLLTDLLALPASEWLDLYLAEESRLLSLIQMGEHLLEIGDLAGATLVLRRLRTLSRGDHRYQGRIYHLYGLLTYREGRYVRSLHWFRLAERATTGSLEPTKRADALYNAGLAMMRTGLLSQSAAKLDEAITVFQHLGNVRKVGYSRLTKANVLLEMQSYREALRVYQRAAHALRGDPWFFDCKLGEAICRWRTRSPENALTLLTRIEKFATDPDRVARYHHNLGVIYRQLGVLDAAIAHLAIALEASASDLLPRPEFLAEMCLCRALVGDAREAVDMLERFTALKEAKDPQDVLAMAILSHVLGRDAFVEPLPRHVTDGYEQRVSAAVSLLQSQQRSERPTVPHGSRSASGHTD